MCKLNFPNKFLKYLKPEKELNLTFSILKGSESFKPVQVKYLQGLFQRPALAPESTSSCLCASLNYSSLKP